MEPQAAYLVIDVLEQGIHAVIRHAHLPELRRRGAGGLDVDGPRVNLDIGAAQDHVKRRVPAESGEAEESRPPSATADGRSLPC